VLDRLALSTGKLLRFYGALGHSGPASGGTRGGSGTSSAQDRSAPKRTCGATPGRRFAGIDDAIDARCCSS